MITFQTCNGCEVTIPDPAEIVSILIPPEAPIQSEAKVYTSKIEFRVDRSTAKAVIEQIAEFDSEVGEPETFEGFDWSDEFGLLAVTSEYRSLIFKPSQMMTEANLCRTHNLIGQPVNEANLAILKAL